MMSARYRTESVPGVGWVVVDTATDNGGRTVFQHRRADVAGTRRDVLNAADTGATFTAPELASVMFAGPVTVMVPDFSDPCGSRKYPRVVADAYPHGAGWGLVFEDSAYPMILRTSATHGYVVTTDAPGVSGPCEGCRADASRRERDTQAASDAAEAAQAEQRAYCQQAERQGFEDGRHAAAEWDVNGTPLPDPVPVPARYADAGLETYYTAGFEAGAEHYDETGGVDASDDDADTL